MKSADLGSRLAESIKRLMAAQSPPWTQAELSRRLGKESGNVNRLLSGRHAPSGKTLAEVATVFGVDVGELLCAPSKAAPKPRKK